MLTKMQREYAEFCAIQEDIGMTKAEFCERLGVTPRGARDWEKKPEFIEAVAAIVKQLDDTTSIYARKTYLWALLEAEKNYKMAKRNKNPSEMRQWWKEITKLAEPASDASPRVDYSEWDLESLEKEAYGRGYDPILAAKTELRGALT